ncbi:MAG: hypothetical protein HYS18_12730 [Burkholderiales bacterium]|nr:hypothetical protein [Burkholderiales bacterium]
MNPEFFDADDTIDLRPKQEILFGVSTVIGILIFSYYGFFLWHEGRPFSAYLNFGYAALGVVVLLWVNFGGKLHLAQNLVLALLIPMFCLVMIEGSPRSEGALWIIIYPLLAFFYKGKNNGMKWLGALIIGLLFVLMLKSLNLLRSPFPVATFLILIACLMTVAMYVYAYDTIRSDAEQTLKAHTQALDDANRKLVDEIAERRAAQQKVLERTHELSELNDELSETVTKLARLNAEKNELMSMIAHDLRNPLTGVLLATKQLEREEHLEAVENRARIAEVKRSIEFTLRLINNFLGVKAMEAGQTALDIQPNDLSAIVAGLAASYGERAAAKEIAIDCRLEQVMASCDQHAATEVAENLISNALKFSPHGSRIEISLAQQNNHAVLTVRDEGPGLSTADKQKMFKMFTRLSAQPTGGEESTGLGLSTAKKLTEMMKGRIRCESEFGHGATFIVELPIAQQSENA